VVQLDLLEQLVFKEIPVLLGQPVRKEFKAQLDRKALLDRKD